MKTCDSVNSVWLVVFCFMVFCMSKFGQNCNAEVNTGVITGCIEGSGVTKTEQRQVDSFNAIDVDGAFDVYIECQREKSVEITTDDNILPHISTKVRGQTLYITSGSICPKSQLDINISIDSIHYFASSGASDVSISNVNNEKFGMSLSGAGDIEVSGRTDKFETDISGAVEIDAKHLLSEETSISASGAAEAEVHASKSLFIEISGVGDICYYGNPGKVVKHVSGVGEIIKR